MGCGPSGECYILSSPHGWCKWGVNLMGCGPRGSVSTREYSGS